MARVRRQILNDLEDGTLTPQSPMTEVRGIGVYIERRLRQALGVPGALTVGMFWRAMRRRTTLGVQRFLYRALQNERANQCVSTRQQGEEARREYHTGDINEFAYAACVALLDHARSTGRVTYGPLALRILPPRSRASQTCGCRPIDDCDGVCTLSDDGRACVPRNHRVRGFVGVTPSTNQRENAADWPRVRRARRITTTRPDADVTADRLANHSIDLQYDRRLQRLWRRPGPRVRAS